MKREYMLPVLVALLCAASFALGRILREPRLIRLWVSCDGQRILVQRLGYGIPPVIAERQLPKNGSIGFQVELKSP